MAIKNICQCALGVKEEWRGGGLLLDSDMMMLCEYAVQSEERARAGVASVVEVKN